MTRVERMDQVKKVVRNKIGENGPDEESGEEQSEENGPDKESREEQEWREWTK